MGRRIRRSGLGLACVFLLGPALPAQDQGPALQKRVQELLAAGQPEEALREVERFLGRHPDSPGALVLKGNLLLGLDRATEAKATYEAAIQAEAGGPAWTGLALAHYELGNMGSATAAAARALEHGELRAELFRLGGTALLQEGRPSGALAWLSAARLLAPADPEACALLSRALLEAGRLEESLQVASEALATFGPREDLVRALARASLAAGQEGEAADLLTLLHRLGRATPEERAALGDLLLRQGEPEQALRLYDEAEAAGSTGREQSRRRALALWRAGRLAEAEALLALEEATLSGAEQVELGRLRLALGRAKSALETFQRAWDAHPGLSSALSGQGEASLALGDLEGARRAFRSLLSREGSSLTAHLGLAEIWERQGDLRASLAELRRARAEAARDPGLLGRILRLERALLRESR